MELPILFLYFTDVLYDRNKHVGGDENVNLDLTSLSALTKKLEQSGVSYSLGGSGLLVSLGLTNAVGDWDVVTDAPKDKVLAALENYEVEDLACGDHPFGTEFKLVIRQMEPPVEIIGGLAIHSAKGLCRLPATAVSLWNGIQMGSPEVWYVAYALMNRGAKADLLLAYLKEVGVNRQMIDMLRELPIPDGILEALVVK
jgi:hypothetical protein